MGCTEYMVWAFFFFSSLPPAAHGVGISYGVGSGATAGTPTTSVMDPKKPPAKTPVSAGQQSKPKVNDTRFLWSLKVFKGLVQMICQFQGCENGRIQLRSLKVCEF